VAKEAPLDKVTVRVNNKDVVLDPANMRYSENSLHEYMGVEYGWVDYLGKQLEHAQKEMLVADIDVEALYSLKFMESKDQGNSDNYAKAFATASVDVVAARKRVVERKEAVGHIKAHLRARDKNHENAQNRGHTLRHEMKILNRDIYESPGLPETSSAEEFLKNN